MIPAAAKSLSDRVAVVGVGNTAFARSLKRDPYVLSAEAFRNALEDSGLRKDQVDGFHPIWIDYDKTAKVLGLNARFGNQSWWHGRLMGNILLEAVMALNCGMANYFAIIMSSDAGSNRRTYSYEDDPAFMAEGPREGGGPHGEDPVYGMTGPLGIFAMWARRYMGLYGATSRDLGAVAVSHRKWAMLNPVAVSKKPMTIEDHQASRWVAEPLHLFDCCMSTDGAVCLILTTAERAKDLKKPPVYVSGISPVGVAESYYFREAKGLAGKGVEAPMDRLANESVDLAYGMAGVGPKDIDALYCYDAFTILPLIALETTRMCGQGEAASFIKGGTIEPGGKFPVNPNGGLLSEAHCTAWNHMVDIARQLRGECGARQVKNARTVLWHGVYADSVVFRRH